MQTTFSEEELILYPVLLKNQPKPHKETPPVATNERATAQPYDARTARILDAFSRETFKHPGAHRRMQWRLAAWAARENAERIARRGRDIGLAGLMLTALSPLLGFFALLIKLDSPGPVFFKQERVGRAGDRFTLYKFRSMTVDAETRKAELLALNEADEVLFKMRQDPRVTRVGRIIRRISVDEFPQLINVIKGEMSLIGPRPALPDEVAQYDFMALRRLDALPGITGLPQISGRSDLPFDRWVALDVQYIEEQSLVNDVVILLKTVPTVMSGKGAY